MMAIKTPNPTDKHVGTRIRMRRLMLGMSQTALADGLDLTFQQIQKYEKGVNRVGASRLQQIAHILRVPVEFFFEGGPGSRARKRTSPMRRRWPMSRNSWRPPTGWRWSPAS